MTLSISPVQGLLSVSGLRLGEARNLKLPDVDLKAAVLTIRGTKFGKTRLVPLHASTCKVLAEYIARRQRHWAGRPVSSYLFASSAGNRLDGGSIHRAFGSADVASDEAMRTDSIFRIASMTKAVTSVGVMILYEQGRFQLTDPVSKYLPEFANMRVISKMADDGTIAETVPAEQPIRIIDLLTHTSFRL